MQSTAPVAEETPERKAEVEDCLICDCLICDCLICDCLICDCLICDCLICDYLVCDDLLPIDDLLRIACAVNGAGGGGDARAEG